MVRLLFAIALLVTLQTVAQRPVPARADEGPSIGISAHRGAMGQWPENSARAFRGSVAAGYDVIEADVQFTKDQVAVMNHEDRLPRRCTQRGRAIHDLTFAEVRKVRCGGEPLPTLDETIAIVRDSGSELKVDVKAYRGQSRGSQRDYARWVTTLLVDSGMAGQSSMQTFEWEVMLPVIHALAPGMVVTALDSRPSRSRARAAARLDAHTYAMDLANASVPLLQYAKAQGLRVGLWSLRSRADLKFAIDMGVNPVSSDRPEVLRERLATLVTARQLEPCVAAEGAAATR